VWKDRHGVDSLISALFYNFYGCLNESTVPATFGSFTGKGNIKSLMLRRFTTAQGFRFYCVLQFRSVRQKLNFLVIFVSQRECKGTHPLFPYNLVERENGKK